MLLKLKRVSRAANEGLTLPSGIILHDEAEDCLYLHDGEAQGGYRFNLAHPPFNFGPGPEELIAGDKELGFFGEVPASELITSTALASLIGLSEGTVQHQNEPWLKFIHHGKVLYVAKKPYRHSISWDAIDACGAVFGTGPGLIEIGEDTYKCRLLTGANTNPTSAAAGNNPPGTEDSEWNDLLYPVHIDDPEGRAWAQYTDADLLTHSTHGNGTYSWCQETSAASVTQRVGRGNSGVTNFNTDTSSATFTARGWRPCLELIVE